jgi:TonB family protein
VARFVIDERGRVRGLEIVELEGDPRFGAAVREAVRQWRFGPAEHGGNPVAVRGQMTFRFEVEER